MTCVHLRKLYELCDENQLEFSSSDLVRIVCKQCEREEVCPSALIGDQISEEPETESDLANRDANQHTNEHAPER